MLFILVMIFSVGFVFAEDTNHSYSNLEIIHSNTIDYDIISTDENKTYTDLLNDVNQETNLTSDYTFSKESDKDIKTVTIGNANSTSYITINGNNHTIDGRNEAGAFKFFNTTITINDLIIKNCGLSAIIAESGSTVILKNVQFINNNDEEEGGAIWSANSIINTNNCLFENNNASTGGGIYAKQSNIYINGTTFINKKPLTWSLVYAINSIVEIERSLFTNTTSRYATALFTQGSKVVIVNSKFENLFANATAGAIAAKTLAKMDNPNSASLIIQNCIFSNVSSTKDAGAIYLDINGDDGINNNEFVLINDTLFDKCSSEFGGALMQLGGRLNILHSTFSNNKATYSGGAAYTSNATVHISGCKFLNNHIIYKDMEFAKGGALYLDNGNHEIEYCNFTDNSAKIGGGICAFDGCLFVRHSYFENNYEGIHAYLLTEGLITNLTYAHDEKHNDTFNMEDESFPTNVFFKGKEIILNPIPVTGSVNDTTFDLRNFAAVTPVENQGQMGACWAFATIGALESAFKKATNITLDISNNNMQNSGLRYSIYGKPALVEGGYIFSGLGYILSWLGVLNTQDDNYDELGKISPLLFTENSHHIQDAIIIEPSNIPAMKDALIKYGALTVFVEGADPNSEYFNKQTNATYCNNITKGNHFVTIVGWDDNYSRSNFKIDPGSDGAWIVKNSWGTNWGDKGYFYLSYKDVPLTQNFAVGYVLNNTLEVYDKLYQYDVASFDGYYSNKQKTDLIYTNTFKNIGGSLVAAIGTFFEETNQDYKITIFVNGDVVHTQEGKSKFSGFETVKLTKQIIVGDGVEFSVQIQSKSLPLLQKSREYFPQGVSILKDGDEIEDLSANSKVACIKAYAFNYENATPLRAYYDSNQIVINSDSEGATITISCSGINISSTTVVGGKAVFNTKLSVGNYTVTTSFNDTEIVNTFEILSTIESLKEYTATYNSRYPISFTFIDSEGNPLVNTNITGLVDGVKVIIGITDKNGAVTVQPSNFKFDLGTHRITVNNPSTNEKDYSVVKVLSRFSGAKNIEMYYFDGTTLKVRTYDDTAGPTKKGEKVVFKIKNKKYTEYTDAKGYVSFKIPNTVTPGNYKIQISYAEQSIVQTVKVKQVLKAKTVTLKKSAKKLVYKVTLKGKKVIKNQKITLNFNGETFKAKTDKKGIAQFTINKNVIEKLKIGKKYAMKITYLKDTIKTILKVKY